LFGQWGGDSSALGKQRTLAASNDEGRSDAAKSLDCPACAKKRAGGKGALVARSRGNYEKNERGPGGRPRDKEAGASSGPPGWQKPAPGNEPSREIAA